VSAYIVWGVGQSSSQIVRGGEAADARDVRDLIASEWAESDERWAVLVECDEADLDAQTRFDRATRGYREVQS
jgi:hypothetical protein